MPESFSDETKFDTQSWNVPCPTETLSNSPLPRAPPLHPALGAPRAKVQVSSDGRQSPALPLEQRAEMGAKLLTRPAQAGRHSGEGRGFVPTEALSAQRLLGEEGKKREEEREEERKGGLPFQSRHPLRVRNQV